MGHLDSPFDDFADARLRAGVAQAQRQDYVAAEASFRAAGHSHPIASRYLLGWLAEQQADRPRARELLLALIADAPEFYQAYVLLGNLALLDGEHTQAQTHYARALSLNPADHGIRLCQGIAWLEQGLWDLAADALGMYLRAQPRDADAWRKLAIAYRGLWRTFHEGLCLERYLALRPDEISAMNDLLYVWIHLGQSERVRQMLHKLLQIDPAAKTWAAGLPAASRAQLAQRRFAWLCQALLLDYQDPDIDDRQLFDAIEHLQAPVPVPVPGKFAPRPQGPLRVGYLSGELGNYSSAILLRPLLKHHSQAVTLYAYNDTDPRLARDSESFKPWFAHWREVQDLDNQALAQTIRADAIDVLVDLGGLTLPARLPLFGLRPASVQVSGLGFVFSSGQRTLDYCLTDRFLCPPPIAARYPETPVYLRSAFHYDPPAIPVEPGDPPCLRRGSLTLGSANTLNKLNLRVVALWARILHALPQARLYLKTPMLSDPLTQDFYHQLFAQFGIAPERLWLAGRSHEIHYAVFYPEIDIALDPFPYQGGVSTCEALWMGVPVVSLAHPQWRARALGADILQGIGQADWLAADEDAYLRRVLSWAADPDFLLRQRHTLRQRLLDSPICDGPGAAAEIEAAYAWMCQQKGTNGLMD